MASRPRPPAPPQGALAVLFAAFPTWIEGGAQRHGPGGGAPRRLHPPIETIAAARTGRPGGGRIFVVWVARSVRVRGGEEVV